MVDRSVCGCGLVLGINKGKVKRRAGEIVQ